MSAPTKAKAQEKLARVTAKIGYPDKWKDYSALVVGRNSYAENVMNADQWLFNDELAKFGKPVDRTEWDMPPQTYNAYYNPSNNEIVLPAAQFSIPASGMRRSMTQWSMAMPRRPSSGTRSRMASMTKGGNSTPRAISRTGGRRMTR